jgi:hypothetical protein
MYQRNPSSERLGDVYSRSARSMLDEFEQRRAAERNKTPQQKQQETIDRLLGIGASVLPIVGTAAGAGIGGLLGGPAGAAAGVGIGGGIGTGAGHVGRELIAMQPHQEEKRRTREEQMLEDALKARIMGGYA